MANAKEDIKLSSLKNRGKDNAGFANSAHALEDPEGHLEIKVKGKDQKLVFDNGAYQGDKHSEKPPITSEEGVSSSEKDAMIYNVSESPPISLTFFFGLQQALLSLSANISVSLLVAGTVCAEEDEEFKAKLMSTTLLMSGVTTLLMNSIGIRLPLFQGAAADYVIPLLAMASINKERCAIDPETLAEARNSSLATNTTFDPIAFNRDKVLYNTQLLQGSLILAGTIQFLIGITGFVGYILKYVGPVTIVPAIFLIGVYLVKATTNFAKVHWGISFITCAISLILGLYMSNIQLPVPIWTRKKGCRSIRYPYQQVFAILIAVLIGWAICGILTAADIIPYDKNSTSFYTRTDARSYIIESSSWFNIPYPGQFGPIGFSASVFVGFMIATFTSILDSIGDYYACASMCRCPPPPAHGVNRGIAIEGLCSAIAGLLGAGHATTTFGGNIGAIGVTKVSSRRVFFVCGLIYVAFGIMGKVSAVFICIPYPVLGGALITMFGMFTGVVLSNLQALDLSSSRNLAIVGISIFTGLMVPHWIEQYPDELATGNKDADEVLKILLGNPNMFGGVLACILDNTVPGTREERGIATWQNVEDPKAGKKYYVEGYEVYDIPIPSRLKNVHILKYLPFLPNPEDNHMSRTLTDDLREILEEDDSNKAP